MGPVRRRWLRAGWYTLALTLVPASARALEVNGGLSLGGILAGTIPHLAVSANIAVSWPGSSGLVFAVKEIVSVLPPTHLDRAGVYEQTGANFGYAWEKRDFTLGPSFSVYSIPSCGPRFCGHVTGFAPGGNAQLNVYLYGNLGLSVNAALDWIVGKSLTLPGGPATMIVAGPMFRWKSE